jgi:hypothetical protein
MPLSLFLKYCLIRESIVGIYIALVHVEFLFLKGDIKMTSRKKMTGLAMTAGAVVAIALAVVFAPSVQSRVLGVEHRACMNMVAAQEKVYTCPMHPEVTSDKPGKCPKCGMNLVPKK